MIHDDYQHDGDRQNQNPGHRPTCHADNLDNGNSNGSTMWGVVMTIMMLKVTSIHGENPDNDNDNQNPTNHY